MRRLCSISYVLVIVCLTAWVLSSNYHFFFQALLEFEKHRWHGSELALPEPSRVEIRVIKLANYM